MDIIGFIMEQDPIVLALFGFAAFLMAPVLWKQVYPFIVLTKKKITKPSPITPDSNDPQIEVIVKEWSDLYKLCHRSKLYDACDKLDETWSLLRKVEVDKNGE